MKLGAQADNMVAIPDFAAGAMENWGLITYRETALLYDEKNYYFTNKRRVAQVVAHELAHQWFGNLVTMKWWDDIWLNEGFAAFVQNIGIDIIADGGFQMETEFVSDQLKLTLELDGTAASHPITYETTYQEEIGDLFDIISYRKGASLLSMISRILGNSNFNKGIQNYLRRYSYKNAEHLDLFFEWDQVVPDSVKGPQGTRLNVTDFALKWTRQMGYPFLSLERMNSTVARVAQQRYKVDPEAKEREKFASAPYGYKWDVPVWIQREGMKDVELKWLASDGDLVINAMEYEAVVFNADSYAIARMNYDDDGWKNVFRELEKNPKVYSERTKYRIVSDSFAMADIGKISYKLAFGVTKYLQNEKSHIPWDAFFSFKDELIDHFGSLSEKKYLQDFLKQLIEPRFKNIDIKSSLSKMVDERSYLSNRVDVLLYIEYCKENVEECKPELDNFYQKQLVEPCGNGKMASECSQVPSGIRIRVYATAVKTGGEKEFQQILELYKRETLNLEKERLMNAMCESRDLKTLKWILTNIIDINSTLLRVQDCGAVAFYLGNNLAASELLLEFLLEKWEQIYEKFSDTRSIINKIITSFTSQIQTTKQLDQLKSFIRTASNTGKFYTFDKQIQRAEKKIRWLRENLDEIVSVLKSHLKE